MGEKEQHELLRAVRKRLVCSGRSHKARASRRDMS